MIRNLVNSVSASSMSRPEQQKIRNKLDQVEQQQQQEENDVEKDTDQDNKKSKPNKYKPFRNTALVLRDVKNSIELRMKARHESKSFAKLTNELATPPIKLYSPFNIYTPSCSGGKGATASTTTTKTKESKSARKSKLSKKRERANKLAMENSMTTMNDSGLECSMALTPASGCSSIDADQQSMTAQGRTPKDRIALRHKKHLMQANAFASFASPTNRLRETVRDVEQFQQCIEDISMAIRARGDSN